MRDLVVIEVEVKTGIIASKADNIRKALIKHIENGYTVTSSTMIQANTIIYTLEKQ